MLAFVAAISLLTGLAFARAGMADGESGSGAALKAGGTRAFGGAERGRLRGALVVAEVSLALMLLVGAGLLLKSFVTLRTRPLGFDPKGVIVANVTLPEVDYASTTETSRYFRDALTSVQNQRDLQAVGLVSALPLARTGARITGDIRPEGEPGTRKGLWVHKIAVGGDYFQAMGIRLHQGRLIDARDGRRRPASSSSASRSRIGYGPVKARSGGAWRSGEASCAGSSASWRTSSRTAWVRAPFRRSTSRSNRSRTNAAGWSAK